MPRSLNRRRPDDRYCRSLRTGPKEARSQTPRPHEGLSAVARRPRHDARADHRRDRSFQRPLPDGSVKHSEVTRANWSLDRKMPDSFLKAAGRYSPNFPALFSRNKFPVPDVPPDHLHRAVPGLVHDRSLRSSRNGRGRGVSGPE
jgi:hypothetical protein